MSTKLHEGDVVCALQTVGPDLRQGLFYVVRDADADSHHGRIVLGHLDAYERDGKNPIEPCHYAANLFKRLGSPMDFKRGSRWLTRNSQCVFFNRAERHEHNNEIYPVFTDKDGQELHYWPTLKRVSKTREMDILYPYDGVGSFLRGPVPPDVEETKPALEPAVEAPPPVGVCEYCSLQYRYRVTHADPCKYTHLEALMPPLAKEIFRRNARSKDEAADAHNEHRRNWLVLSACERTMSKIPADKLAKDLVSRYKKLTGTPTK